MPYTINQRVRVKETAFEFGGTEGRIELPPAGLAEIDPDPWLGPFKYEKRRRVAVLWWVTFDTPTDDGSGDGPYWGCGIDEEDLGPIDQER